MLQQKNTGSLDGYPYILYIKDLLFIEIMILKPLFKYMSKTNIGFVGYEAHAMSTNDERVKKILYHIADEERQHVGELQQLLYILSPKEAQYIEKGKQDIIKQQQQNFQTTAQ